MTHPKNSTTQTKAQVMLTTEVGFCETPIDNKGIQVFQVAAGVDIQDALETAKALSSGLGQLCSNLHDTLNMGDLAYCDGVKTMAFLADAVSALVWSVQQSYSAEVKAGATK